MTISAFMKTSRPRFWIYLIGPYLVGMAAAGSRPEWTSLVLGLYVTLPANLLIYGVNDIFDQDTDSYNIKKDHYESRLTAHSVKGLAVAIVTLNIPFLFVLAFGLPAISLIWLAVFLVTGVGYSAPPLRAKVRPFLDAACNILYVAPAFAAYTAQAGQSIEWPIIIASLTWCMAMHAYSAVPDIAADTASRLSTIATVLGGRLTIVFCALCYASAALLGWGYIGWYAAFAGFIYVGLMAASWYVAGNHTKLFALYKLFPYINSALGAGLFFVVLAG